MLAPRQRVVMGLAACPLTTPVNRSQPIPKPAAAPALLKPPVPFSIHRSIPLKRSISLLAALPPARRV